MDRKTALKLNLFRIFAVEMSKIELRNFLISFNCSNFELLENSRKANKISFESIQQEPVSFTILSMFDKCLSVSLMLQTRQTTKRKF